MKKINLILITIVLLVLSACDQPITYLYSEKPQPVDCPGIDKALMHEALYSFQEDIGVFYNKYTDYRDGTNSYYLEGYSQYIYTGFLGTARYADIVSPHSLDILNKLKEIDGLIVQKDGKNVLNYDHEYVSCLLTSVTNADLNQQFQSMRKVNILNPEAIANVMRKNVMEVVQDPYLAMYMCLDAYYVYLSNLDIEKK